MNSQSDKLYGLRIALVQFAPVLKKPKENAEFVETLLKTNEIQINSVDILVLPEFAFTGYVFTSPKDIESFLESGENGFTVTWAQKIHQIYGCTIIVGFPEIGRYNSVCIVDEKGTRIYRKTHLFETDEQWGCNEGSFNNSIINIKGYRFGIGICMDLNPYRFTADFNSYEFANFLLSKNVDMVIVPMAWLRQDETTIENTLNYWIMRLNPFYSNTEMKKSIVFFASNRIGKEFDKTFAGCSCAIMISPSKIRVLNNLSMEDQGILIVDI